MTLEGILRGTYDTDSERYSAMTNAQINERFGYHTGYIHRMRATVRRKDRYRRERELAESLKESQQWLKKTSQMIMALEAIEEGLAERGAQK
jgi:hypothetical protein